MKEEDDNAIDPQKARKQTLKERAKQKRREDYQKAKERQKNDPKFQAKKAADKEKRKQIYREAKLRQKEHLKKAKDKKQEAAATASLAADEARPLAPVISLELHRRRRQASAAQAERD